MEWNYREGPEVNIHPLCLMRGVNLTGHLLTAPCENFSAEVIYCTFGVKTTCFQTLYTNNKSEKNFYVV